MRKEDFAEAFGDINEKHILEARAKHRVRKTVWGKWGALAACLCLVATVAVTANLFPGNTPIPPDNSSDLPDHNNPVPSRPSPSQEDQHTEGLQTPWTIHYNEVSTILSANRAYIKGAFTETLNDAELAALKPNEDLDCSGYARFDNNGNLLDIAMQVATTLPESPVTVGLADYCFGFDCVLSGGEMVSVCNGLDYRVYQYELGNTVELSAYTMINDLYFIFSMDVPKASLDQAKADFQYVLECFAYYDAGKPDLSIIVPEEIPELMEQVFTSLSEAQAEPDFGLYMPSELPAGFGESTIYRFKFQNSNFLSALWSKGLDDLSWVVKPYTEEDAHRLTGVDDKENYDLSLYPIPRADSVPDELREIVDDPIFAAEDLTLEAVYCRAYKVDDSGDSDGWRMRFSVKYGDIMVSVSAKGVDPGWLYQQLMLLKMK